jgi:hypothetical protein
MSTHRGTTTPPGHTEVVFLRVRCGGGDRVPGHIQRVPDRVALGVGDILTAVTAAHYREGRFAADLIARLIENRTRRRG